MIDPNAFWQTVYRKNHDNTGNAPDGGELRYMLAGTALLIGEDHSQDAEDHVRAQQNAIYGILTVHRPTLKYPHGRLRVIGCTDQQNQENFKEAVRRGGSQKHLSFRDEEETDEPLAGGDEVWEPPPETFDEVYQSDRWWPVYAEWARGQYMGESVDFLEAALAYRRQWSNDEAQRICDTFIRATARQSLNIDDEVRNRILQRLNEGGVTDDLFYEAETFVMGLCRDEYPRKFLTDQRNMARS